MTSFQQLNHQNPIRNTMKTIQGFYGYTNWTASEARICKIMA